MTGKALLGLLARVLLLLLVLLPQCLSAAIIGRQSMARCHCGETADLLSKAHRAVSADRLNSDVPLEKTGNEMALSGCAAAPCSVSLTTAPMGRQSSVRLAPQAGLVIAQQDAPDGIPVGPALRPPRPAA